MYITGLEIFAVVTAFLAFAGFEIFYLGNSAYCVLDWVLALILVPTGLIGLILTFSFAMLIWFPFMWPFLGFSVAMVWGSWLALLEIGK